MAKITRPNVNVQAFGSQTSGTGRTIFGDSVQSDDLTTNLNTAFFQGWNTVGQKPPRQWENGAMYTVSQLVSYLFQAGIPEWNTNQEYHINSITIGTDGNLYKSITNSNSGNDPVTDGGVNWDDIAGVNDFVNLTTAQTVGGVKTFSSFPVTPSSAPTADYQVANKKYVDDNALGVGQTWQNVTASRSNDVTYTNTTGRPIMFTVTTNSAAYAVPQMFVDGISVMLAPFDATNGRAAGWALVPAGSTYKCIAQPSIATWYEYR